MSDISQTDEPHTSVRSRILDLRGTSLSELLNTWVEPDSISHLARDDYGVTGFGNFVPTTPNTEEIL